MDLAEKILNGWTITKPQRQFLLNLFTTILALRGKVTFRNLSRYSDHSARTYARQFDQVLASTSEATSLRLMALLKQRWQFDRVHTG